MDGIMKTLSFVNSSLVQATPQVSANLIIRKYMKSIAMQFALLVEWSMIALIPTDFVVRSLNSALLRSAFCDNLWGSFLTMFKADSADVTKAFGWSLVDLSRQTTCSNRWSTTGWKDSISGMKNKKIGVEMSWLSSWLKSSWKSPALYYSTLGPKMFGVGALIMKQNGYVPDDRNEAEWLWYRYWL
mgnify:CR=1 FL=1